MSFSPESAPTPILERAFWKRFVMLVAGPLVNLVLAIVIIMAGTFHPGRTYRSTRVSSVA